MTKPRLTADTVAKAFDGHVQSHFPPLLTESQAIELLQIDQARFNRWKASGKLNACCCHRGRLVRYWRDWLVEWFFNGSITSPGTSSANCRITIKRAAALYTKHLETEGRVSVGAENQPVIGG